MCFAHRGGNEANERLLGAVNRAGQCYLTHTILRGRYALRMCVGQTHTREEHVRAAWKSIREAAAGLG